MNLIKGINSFIILIIIIECHEMKILYRALLYVAFMPQMKWHCLLVLSVICIFYNYLYSPVSYYNEDRRLPIYSSRKDGFSLSEIGNHIETLHCNLSDFVLITNLRVSESFFMFPW